MSAAERYERLLAQEWPTENAGNRRFYLEFLFKDTTLGDKTLLDVGAGDGLFAFYPVCAGAREVVALEPEMAGSTAGVGERFARARERLGIDTIELLPETFQSFDPGGRRFDVVFMHAAVNHLDEPACIELHRDAGARESYRRLFAKLADLSADGARLIVADCSPRNLFARLPVTNPVAPTIEWEKHQPPALWAELLEEAAFEDPRIRWTSFNTLRKPGRALLGNRVAGWFLTSGFCLTMTRRARPG